MRSLVQYSEIYRRAAIRAKVRSAEVTMKPDCGIPSEGAKRRSEEPRRTGVLLMLMSSTLRTVCLFGALSSIACTKNIINPGEGDQPAPSTMTSVAGNNQTGAPGQALSTPPAVRVSSSDGRPVKDVSVFFEARGGGSVTDGVVRSDANGVAVAGKWVLGPNPGQQTLSATLPGVATLTFVATAVGGGTRIARSRPDRIPSVWRHRFAEWTRVHESARWTQCHARSGWIFDAIRSRGRRRNADRRDVRSDRNRSRSSPISSIPRSVSSTWRRESKRWSSADRRRCFACSSLRTGSARTPRRATASCSSSTCRVERS